VAVVAFSLQPVLSYKESLVDLFERQLAQLFATRKAVETMLMSLYQERHQIHHLLATERRGVLQLDRLWHHQVYLDWLAERIHEQERQLAQLGQWIEEKRRELLAAMQEKRMLEKLKEKATERFMVEQEHREADFYDEMATARFGGLTGPGR